jgi:hypothetical protein
MKTDTEALKFEQIQNGTNGQNNGPFGQIIGDKRAINGLVLF